MPTIYAPITLMRPKADSIFNVWFCASPNVWLKGLILNDARFSVHDADTTKLHLGKRSEDFHFVEADEKLFFRFTHKAMTTPRDELIGELAARGFDGLRWHQVMAAYGRFAADEAAAIDCPWLEGIFDRRKQSAEQPFGFGTVGHMQPGPEEKPPEQLPGAPISVRWVPFRGLVPENLAPPLNFVVPTPEPVEHVLTGRSSSIGNYTAPLDRAPRAKRPDDERPPSRAGLLGKPGG